MFDMDEIVRRSDIVAIIGEHVQLRPQGGEYVGLCPFHQETSPSFSVNPEKGVWHCFGCGKCGDVITFVQKIEGRGSPDAVELLAQRVGVRSSATDARSRGAGAQWTIPPISRPHPETPANRPHAH